jgi:NitT/TauT family transport system substrate-binding protein
MPFNHRSTQWCRFGIAHREFLHFPATSPKRSIARRSRLSDEGRGIMMRHAGKSRRSVLKAGAALAGALAAPAIVSNHVLAQAGTRPVNLQLGFLAGGNQLGEVVAKHLGYFEEEKLQLVIQPGGPNNDGIAAVASGRFEIGQISSSPSLMLAASQSIPIRSFAVNVQKHPYAFKKHNIPESDVKIQVMGSNMAPLLTGQVHAVTGWLSNTTALAVLGPGVIPMTLWDNGVQLYASVYYATADTLRKNPDLVAGYVRAASKGWAYAYANREAAVDLLVKEFPNAVRADELAAADVMMQRVFTPATAKSGWGVFEPEIWQSQIDLYSALGQFSAGAPKLDAVITTSILEATAASRPKLG